MKRALFALLLTACAPPAPPIMTTAGGQEMVVVPASEGQPSFLIDRTEATQDMLDRLQISDPSRNKGPRHPIDNVTWIQAVRICNARSAAEGLEPCYDEETAECDPTKNGYRLPTEAEWEYACRAGKGDPPRMADHAWFAENAQGRTHPAGSKRPNAWGIHDMHGNVAEWCNDPFTPDGSLYAVRGGSFKSSAAQVRSSARDGDRPGFGDACLAPDTLGFRCVRKP
ncbi:MAG: SUMF1/EgtB/PvdO family nonheme iron enzyme [Planctomycetes bacterium]|nr:SUMF1/EgtB/PvdO family nonheme iron enzyme [Planctomycetota bacterium]